MPTEQRKPRANPTATSARTGTRAAWGRPLAVATAVLFFISLAFPVVAGLAKNTAMIPKVWGRLDVGLAFLLIMMAFAIFGLTGGKVNRRAEEASYRAYRILNHGILVLVVVFFLFGERIVWMNCLTGFAWRAWLLVFGLPAWFAAMGNAPDNQASTTG